MLITNKIGDVLTSQTQVIAHQVNCKGVMGAGLAGQIRTKYPIVYEYYSAIVKRGEELLGSCQMVPIDKRRKRYICNLFAQDGYGHHGQWTQYEALEKSLMMLKRAMIKYKLISFSIPYKMSCGLGGGDWDKVLEIIHKVFDETNFVLEIWELK